MEAREAIYPHILLLPSMTREWDNAKSMRESTLVIEDMPGRHIVIPVSLPFTGGETIMDFFVNLRACELTT